MKYHSSHVASYPLEPLPPPEAPKSAPPTHPRGARTRRPPPSQHEMQTFACCFRFANPTSTQPDRATNGGSRGCRRRVAARRRGFAGATLARRQPRVTGTKRPPTHDAPPPLACLLGPQPGPPRPPPWPHARSACTHGGCKPSDPCGKRARIGGALLSAHASGHAALVSILPYSSIESQRLN